MITFVFKYHNFRTFDNFCFKYDNLRTLHEIDKYPIFEFG